MKPFDLDALSLAELKALHKDVTKAIAEFSDRKKTEAMQALEAHAKELGFSLAELTGTRKTRRSSGWEVLSIGIQRMPPSLGRVADVSPVGSSPRWRQENRRSLWRFDPRSGAGEDARATFA